jgi:formyltetrahydrofolate deformylase
VLHCASDLLARVSIGALGCEVVAVVSDYPDGAELAARHDVAFVHLPLGDDRSGQEAALEAVLDELDADLVVLARYMRILPRALTERWAGRMINIHHSFLPAFAGAGPYARAHERGVKLIGATAHYVTAELDAGPIIAQDVERVSHRDSVDDLIRRGADVERSVLAAAVRLHLEHRVMVFGNRTCVFD